MKNDNKGFSLIELIVVIAIMAILVGVLAPNVLKYVESSRESADKQAVDAVRTAVMTALVDPAVGNAAPTAGTYNPASDTTFTTGNFATVFAENLGTTGGMTGVAGTLKSKKYAGGTFSVIIGATNDVEVTLQGSTAVAGKIYKFSTKNGETSATAP